MLLKTFPRLHLSIYASTKIWVRYSEPRCGIFFGRSRGSPVFSFLNSPTKTYIAAQDSRTSCYTGVGFASTQITAGCSHSWNAYLLLCALLFRMFALHVLQWIRRLSAPLSASFHALLGHLSIFRAVRHKRRIGSRHVWDREVFLCWPASYFVCTLCLKCGKASGFDWNRFLKTPNGVGVCAVGDSTGEPMHRFFNAWACFAPHLISSCVHSICVCRLLLVDHFTCHCHVHMTKRTYSNTAVL